MKIKEKNFFIRHEEKFVIGIAFVLVFLLGFSWGKFFALERKIFKNPIQILKENPLEASAINVSDTNDPININNTQTNQQEQIENKKTENINEEKRFVGSINSNKYHLSTCPNAKKIKEKIWFSSEKEAEEKGYQKAKCCFKE